MTLKAGYFVLVPPLKGIGPLAWSTVAETGLGRACGSGSVLVRFFLGPGEAEGGGSSRAGAHCFLSRRGRVRLPHLHQYWKVKDTQDAHYLSCSTSGVVFLCLLKNQIHLCL